MRDTRGAGYEVEGKLSGHRISLGIHAGAMAHIMNVLTDLYSDRELAVIREYSTNALDSHIAAGVSLPIEVTLPSHLSPFLTIKDYGLGLSRQDIEEIYSQYGASTKRDSDDFNGMLGLGCKSALTYAHQFTVTGVKDGIRSQVSVSRDETGGGSMTVVDESPTSDASGVTIQIPVRAYNDMDSKAKAFFSYWPSGSVLVNGREPASMRESALRLTDELWLVKGYNRDKIVMGNVAYPFRPAVSIARDHSLVAFVDMGRVNFTPSRESLFINDLTQETIARVSKDAAAALSDAIQVQIDACTTRADALSEFMRWHDVAYNMGQRRLTYKGRAIPLAYELPGTRVRTRDFYGRDSWGWDDSKQAILWTDRSGSVLSRHSFHYTVNLDRAKNGLWFYGYNRRKFSAPMKRKLKQWAVENNRTEPHFFLCERRPDFEGWIDRDDAIIPWSEVEAIRLPTNRTSQGGPYAGRTRPSGSYDTMVDGTWVDGVMAADIDTRNPVYYMANNYLSVNPYAAIVARYEDRFTVVYFPKNRETKFCRDFPSAKPLRARVYDLYRRWAAKVTDDDLYALTLQDDHYLCLRLQLLDPTKVRDPELVRAIQCSQKDLTRLSAERMLFYRVMFERAEYRGDIEPFAKYPLFDKEVHTADPEHSYIYLNAVHAA